MNGFYLLVLGLGLGFMGGLHLAPPKSTEVVEPPARRECIEKPAATGAPTVGGDIRKETVLGEAEASLPPGHQKALEDAEGKVAANLAKLSLVGMRAQCTRAEEAWLKRNIDGYFTKARDAAEKKSFATALYAQLKDPLKTVSWWRSEIDFPGAENLVHMDIMLKIYGARETDLGDPFKVSGASKINSPDDICYALSPFTSVGGHLDNSSFSNCGGPDRKKGDSFFMAYNTYMIDKVAPAVTAILFPFPTKGSAPLQYLATPTGQWVQAAQFAWRPSSYEEWQELHDHYVQSFEH